MVRRSRQSGFTVIEAVVAAFIASMALFLAVTVYTASFRSYRTQHLKSAAIRSSELAMEYLTRDIRAASQVVSSYGGVATLPSAVVLKAPSYNAHGVIDGSFDYIAYEIDRLERRLIRSVWASAGSRTNETERILARNVDNIALTYHCLDVFDGNGAAQTFSISHPWSGAPSVRINGVLLTSGYSLSTGAQTITFAGAPVSGSVIEVIYPVSPADASALADAHMITVRLTCRADEADEDQCSVLDSTIRLRNRR